MKDAIKEVEKKRTRVPIADQRDQLTVQGLDTDNYSYRWVNDIGDRIAKFQLAGWNFVRADDKIVIGDQDINWSKPQFSLVSRGVGGGVQSYLMGIPKEFFSEDQAKKSKVIDEVEATIYQNAQRPGNYGKVKVQHVPAK
jgi:hypothetical protein